VPETNVEWRCAKRLNECLNWRGTRAASVCDKMSGGGDRETGTCGSRLDDGCTGTAALCWLSEFSNHLWGCTRFQLAVRCPGLAGLGWARLPGKGAVDCFFPGRESLTTAGAIFQVRSFFIRTGPSDGPPPGWQRRGPSRAGIGSQFQESGSK
jgi:hypothetical protein